ncbi:FAS1 domain-containing protein [Mollisia scopiformis]|uniref:FAS1 domain-containing protein n=1 Tax=Mollisia scopiformis TaxID=149040 RepID=A0A132B7U2_MOLSC|nr:FAS1 domain-containing protein [Mollisia scopiformis]KUJ08476.1 FAS1 domain-containing protein [Mollisia scopiformis]
MRRIYLLILTFVEHAFGQALLSILQSTPGTLSTLNSLINSSTTAKNLLSTANNFTFLAPSNDAFKKWLADQGPTSPSQDLIDATLSYHLVNGGFPTVLFSSKPQFVSTKLSSAAFTNVTNGQVVELFQNGKESEFLSGSKTLSTITSADIVCTGGLIHVIDTVLDVPQGLVTVITQSNLTFFIGGFLNVADQPLVLPVLNGPGVTIFAPNTASALSKFTSLTANATQSELGDVFNYHVVPNFSGYSSNLRNGLVLKTMQGDNLTITIQGNDTFVNQAKIISTDFLIANGVLHTIDRYVGKE